MGKDVHESREAMKKIIGHAEFLSSLPKTRNTPRQQRIWEVWLPIAKKRAGVTSGNGDGWIRGEWEYLKTMATDEELEDIVLNNKPDDVRSGDINPLD